MNSIKLQTRRGYSRREVLRDATLVASSLALNNASGSSFRGLAATDAKRDSMLSLLTSPVLFQGDAKTAFRDPAAIFHAGWFYLYFTLIKTEDSTAYSYVAWSKSPDLRNWSPPKIITPRDKALDFGSPGGVVKVNDQWVLCLQTYPRPHGEKYGNGDSRLWTMQSEDLEHWGVPELLEVKGPSISKEAMGRMIDPYLLRDKNQSDKWWCFYKQDGIQISSSNDLRIWTPFGRINAGENPCVVVDHNEYVLFHSPPNGIGIKRSPDLSHWRDEGVLTLGQADWPWAQGRLTAAFVADLRSDPSVGKALMFFHGSRYLETDSRGGFDNFASIGIAWSSDLHTWSWPGSNSPSAV